MFYTNVTYFSKNLLNINWLSNLDPLEATFSFSAFNKIADEYAAKEAEEAQQVNLSENHKKNFLNSKTLIWQTNLCL